MIPVAYKEPLTRFLSFILPDDPSKWIEVRTIDNRAISIHWANTINAIVGALISPSVKRENVYFGVMLRDKRGGTKDDVVATGDILWADLDIKDGSSLKDLITTVLPAPCVIVATGHGYHAYWKLKEPVSKDLIETINRNIADILGSDNVGDAARIMRLPYTINSKPGQPQIQSDVIRLEDDCEGHYITSFLINGSDKREVARAKKAKKLVIHDGHKSRSEKLFAIACNYVMSGGKDLDSLEQMMYSVPEGEKLDEMSPARRKEWVRLTYLNARKTIWKRAKT